MRKNRGFTLIELMIVVVILSVVIVGMARLFIFTSTLSEISGNKTKAVSEAQGKVEEIRNHDYDDIAADYDGTVFPLVQLTGGKGFIYINSSDPELLIIEVSACWRDQHGRVIGDDLNLNGVLDSGEGTGGKIDSPVKIITMLTRR